MRYSREEYITHCFKEIHFSLSFNIKGKACDIFKTKFTIETLFDRSIFNHFLETQEWMQRGACMALTWYTVRTIAPLAWRWGPIKFWPLHPTPTFLKNPDVFYGWPLRQCETLAVATGTKLDLDAGDGEWRVTLRCILFIETKDGKCAQLGDIIVLSSIHNIFLGL